MNNNYDEKRPKLKKIKRPINRTMPIGNSQNQAYSQSADSMVPNQNNTQSQQNPMTILSPQIQARNSGELNEYLDGNKNIAEPVSQKNNLFHNYQDDEDMYYDQSTADVPQWLNLKVFVFFLVVSVFLGAILGKLLFSQSTVVRNGLQGVVVNSEVPRGRARCGIAERTQGCVLYIMNPQRQEMSAKDFYEVAAQMTGRQRFMIETGNMRYANTKIKPGDIAQLNIPPL